MQENSFQYHRYLILVALKNKLKIENRMVFLSQNVTSIFAFGGERCQFKNSNII